MLNKAILTGRLTAKPELKTTPSGVSVTQFTIAVQRGYKDADGQYPTDFINAVAWRKTAEFAAEYFDKGQLITAVGSIQTRKYEDKDGNRRTAFEVIADEIMFAGSKRESAADTPEQTAAVSEDENLPF